MAFASPVVPDVHCTKAASGSHRVPPSSGWTPSGRTSAAAPTVRSARSTSGSGARQLTGTNRAPASHTPNIVVTISGPFGNCTATGWPDSTPAPRSCSIEVAAARRASPAVTERSIVCSRAASSSNGCATSRSARLTRILYTTPAVLGKEARVSEGPSITDEGVARLRARIGVPQPHPQPPHYRCPNEDAFRQVAQAYGDDNPLWCDPAYAAGTRWGGPIAPPHLVGGDTLIGEDEVTTLDGDRDRRRGAEPRWWEDVSEGDELDPLVKGPMRVTDMVVWHTGMGMGLYGVKALRLAHDQRHRMPRFFRPDV